MSKEDEGFFEAKARRKRGAQGKPAEEVAHKALAELRASNLNFDFDRMLDSRAAGRTVSATVADFTFCYQSRAGALEIKSMKDGHRLAYSDFPQYPRMKRRAAAGALCLVAVYTRDARVWNIANVRDLEEITRGSWDITAAGWTDCAVFKTLFEGAV